MANHTFFSISTTYKWDHKIGWNAFTMYLYIVQRNRICPTSFIWQDDHVSKFALKLKITWLTIILVFPNKNVRYIWTSQILRQTQIFWLLSPNCHAFCPNNIFSYQTHRCIGDLISHISDKISLSPYLVMKSPLWLVYPPLVDGQTCSSFCRYPLVLSHSHIAIENGHV